MAIKPQTVIPPGTPITRGPTVVAKGAEFGRMRARGARGTESRLPSKGRSKPKVTEGVKGRPKTADDIARAVAFMRFGA